MRNKRLAALKAQEEQENGEAEDQEYVHLSALTEMLLNDIC